MLDWRSLGVVSCNRSVAYEIIVNRINLQYYRQARMQALHKLFPDYVEEIENSIGTLKYPRPISEPPSPSSSRVTTPAASVHGSDDEDDSVDEEGEVSTATI